MGDLIEQLGINWKLLLSQAVNFFLILIVLKTFIYKPILDLLKKRSEKIEEGLAKAEEAGVRLKEVDNISKEKIKEAENTSLNIIKATQEKGKSLEQELVKKAEDKQKELLQKALSIFEKQKEEAKESAYKEAVAIVKSVIYKTVELDSEKIDKALIEKAISQVKEYEASN